MTRKILAAQRRVERCLDHYCLSRRVALGLHVTVNGRPSIHKATGSRIVIGNRVTLTSRSADNDLVIASALSLRTLWEHAEIAIGDDTGISGGAICAGSRVSLGRRVLVGADCIITDSDHHAVDLTDVSTRRYARIDQSAASEIRIEDDVFIGARSIVLKGVTIGHGSVIGAGSVVVSPIPPMVVAAGNPCRVIRALDTRAADNSDSDANGNQHV